jgi:hypothetical protein
MLYQRELAMSANSALFFARSWSNPSNVPCISFEANLGRKTEVQASRYASFASVPSLTF